MKNTAPFFMQGIRSILGICSWANKLASWWGEILSKSKTKTRFYLYRVISKMLKIHTNVIFQLFHKICNLSVTNYETNDQKFKSLKLNSQLLRYSARICQTILLLQFSPKKLYEKHKWATLILPVCLDYKSHTFPIRGSSSVSREKFYNPFLHEDNSPHIIN